MISLDIEESTMNRLLDVRPGGKTFDYIINKILDQQETVKKLDSISYPQINNIYQFLFAFEGYKNEINQVTRKSTYCNICIFCGNMWETYKPVQKCKNRFKYHFDNDKLPNSYHYRP